MIVRHGIGINGACQQESLPEASPTANDLLHKMWLRQDYTGFAMSVQGSEFKVADDDLCDLKKIERLLQSDEAIQPRALKTLGKKLYRIIARIKEEEI